MEKTKKCVGIKRGVIHPARSRLWVRGGQGTRVKAECKECCLQPQKTEHQRPKRDKIWGLAEWWLRVKVTVWVILARAQKSPRMHEDAWRNAAPGALHQRGSAVYLQWSRILWTQEMIFTNRDSNHQISIRCAVEWLHHMFSVYSDILRDYHQWALAQSLWSVVLNKRY